MVISKLATRTLLSNFYHRFVEQMQLDGGERVLELGPGDGALARHIAPILEGNGGKLTCVDVSGQWLDATRHTLRKHDNVEYLRGEVDRLKLEPGSFDAVALHFVLHDVYPGRRLAILQALSGLLKPGGRIFLREPTNNSRGIKATEVRRLMHDSGFEVVRSEAFKQFAVGPIFSATYSKH
ncbi:MAG: class I SAM-dependent methyltransferase [Candidatus Alcyoniella australis]|nr:class I SAM-dependent methyltransferase [Candidatus Alcyoniella australis]